VKGPNGYWYDKRKDGEVAVDLYRYNDYFNTNKDYFCCPEGIKAESEEYDKETWEPTVPGVTERHITFVISKNKPEDGICREIWAEHACGVSAPMEEAYRAAAGIQVKAWYWLEVSE